MLTGVYGIVNMKASKVYVGSAIDIHDRIWFEHLWALRRGIHFNRYLQAAWNKDGEESFAFVLIEEYTGDDWARDRERIETTYINLYWDEGIAYNLSPSAKTITGIKMTPEQRRRNSELRRGKKRSDETKLRISESGRGKKRSAEQRRRMSEVRLGCSRTEETRKKISDSKRGRPWTQARRDAQNRKKAQDD